MQSCWWHRVCVWEGEASVHSRQFSQTRKWPRPNRGEGGAGNRQRHLGCHRERIWERKEVGSRPNPQNERPSPKTLWKFHLGRGPSWSLITEAETDDLHTIFRFGMFL